MKDFYDKLLMGQKIESCNANAQEKKQIQPRGIIYTRISSSKQTEMAGLESQKKACEVEAQRMSVPITKVFIDEAVSGRSLDRGGINSAIQFIESESKHGKPITHMFMSECSRLSRSDFFDALALERSIKVLGVKIIFVNTPGLNREDGSTEIIKTLSYYAAAEESKRIGERTRNGKRNKVFQGYRPYRPPLGYKSGKEIDPNTGRSIYVILRDEPMATYMQMGFEMFASGELQSQMQLFNFLFEKGVRTKYGKLVFTVIEKMFNAKRLMLYAGYISEQSIGITDLIKAKHEPIISLETARKIYERIHGKEKSSLRIRKDFDERLPLRGILYCGECGNRISGGGARGKCGVYYPYYQCCTRSCSEKSKTISAPKLHEELKKNMMFVESDGLSKIFDVLFDEVLEYNLRSYEDTKSIKQKKIDEISSEINKTMEKIMAVSNTVVMQKLEERLAELENQKSELNSEVESNVEVFDKKELYDEVSILFKNPWKIWDLGNEEVKQLLMGVQYNGKIIYKKGQGVLNSETSLFNWLNSMSSTNITGIYPERDSNPHILSDTRFGV